MIPVALEVAIDTAHEREAPDVKLPSFVEHRLLNILLDDVAALVSIDIRVLDQVSNLVKLLAHLDAASSICVFTRLDNPEILSELRVLIKYGVLV